MQNSNLWVVSWKHSGVVEKVHWGLVGGNFTNIIGASCMCEFSNGGFGFLNYRAPIKVIQEARLWFFYSIVAVWSFPAVGSPFEVNIVFSLLSPIDSWPNFEKFLHDSISSFPSFEL